MGGCSAKRARGGSSTPSLAATRRRGNLCGNPYGGRRMTGYIDFHGIGDISQPDYQARRRRQAKSHLEGKVLLKVPTKG